MSKAFPEYWTAQRKANALHNELAELYRGKTVDWVLTEKYWREIEFYEAEAANGG